MAEPILELRNLTVRFRTKRGSVPAVDGVSFAMAPGEILGIVGESGCGKSTLCTAITGLLPHNAEVGGEIVFRGENLLQKSAREMRDLRGRDITMVLQNPMTALDPVFSVGSQLREILHYNADMPSRERESRALQMLQQVHIPEPKRRLENFPHQMSGGMKQRVLTAMATALNPTLLLADEPTTALDVTIQEQILRLLVEIRETLGTGIVMVTHDLGVVRRLCDRVVIMYAGRAVETGETEAIFANPQHPYTAALLASIPRIGMTRDRLTAIRGQIPDLRHLPPGCAFAPRCPEAMARCNDAYPPPLPGGTGWARCWLREGKPT
ncbi:MAG: ABC transporter ATP-binding protein [Alphaproteobacteria bacterium]|nr:ABC transporter ATP-binding protein [Alphaproteobacteria bacterium]MCB9930301.1 ABC transporter ATP-binding protein [Alphaproteobacteria bacterium]